jgi:hypothetical protein
VAVADNEVGRSPSAKGGDQSGEECTLFAGAKAPETRAWRQIVVHEDRGDRRLKIRRELECAELIEAIEIEVDRELPFLVDADRDEVHHRGVGVR